MNKQLTPRGIAADLLRVGGRVILALVLVTLAFIVAAAIQDIWPV